MTQKEIHIALGLSMIFALRMSGIFMILPVLTIHAVSLQGANGHLIGIAIGIYGFLQIIFQLPFGLMSDKIGYKPVIIVGLVLFAIGSEVAAVTENIWGLIVGRALQGSGAIGSSLIAVLLESVQEEHRTKAMALVGMSFGVTFTISIICGPIIADILGLYGLFHTITILTILAIIVTCIVVSSNTPKLKKNNKNLFITFNEIQQILTNLHLMKLNISIFCIHTILMLNFIAIPKIMIKLGFARNVHWKIYSVIMCIATIIVLAYAFIFERKKGKKNILIICMYLLFLSELIMLNNILNNFMFLCGIQLFFIAFNLIETILPILISKKSPKKYKGTTISIYSIGQFLGVGFGGILGGILLETQGTCLVLLCALIISILCIIINTILQ